MQHSLHSDQAMRSRSGEATAAVPAVGAGEPLRILHLAAPARYGGLERVVGSLCAGQRRAGHRVHFLGVVDEGTATHPLTDQLAAADVEVTLLAIPPRAYGRERAAVAELCRRLRPDVVHTHGYRPDVLDSPVVRRLGIPVVSTVHGFVRGSRRGRIYEWLQRRAYRRFDAVAAVSRAQVEELVGSGVPADRVHLIPNAWVEAAPALTREAARARLGVLPGTFVVGWVGRLGREKGADVLLDALARLSGDGLEAVLLGGGVEEADLRAQARGLKLETRVRWLGPVADAGALFPGFDVFVLSSRTEGVPIVLFEAMSAGTPIVATQVGGVPDVLSGEEALLVPGEDADALARALGSVQGDPETAAHRADRARRRLRAAFAPGPWLARYETVYRQAHSRVRTRLPEQG